MWGTLTAGPAYDVCLGVKFTRYLFAGVYTGIAAPKYRGTIRSVFSKIFSQSWE